MTASGFRKRLRIGWLVVGGIVLLFVAVRLVQRGRASRDIGEIRKAGYPTTLQELQDWYPDVPAAENAALKILEAADVKHDPPQNGTEIPGAGRVRWPEPGVKMTKTEREALKLHLEENADALRLLREAATLPRSRYPMDLTSGFNALLPHLAQIKALAQLLKRDALLHADAGRPDEAVKSMEASFALAGSLASEPALISDLVRIACVSITLGGMEHALADLKFSDVQLRRLSEWVSKTEQQGVDAYVRSMAGERCVSMAAFSNPAGLFGANAGQGGARMPVSGFMFTLIRLSGLLERDRNFLMRTLGRSIEAAKLPFPDSVRKTEALKAEQAREFASLSGRLLVFSRMLLPALDKAFLKEARIACDLRAARTALAIERYRLAHDGRLPETLDALVPAFLNRLPTDTFDGSALEMERLPRGYRIVCRGATEWTTRERQALPKKNEVQKPVGFTVAR
jgi:hypothetical protein